MCQFKPARVFAPSMAQPLIENSVQKIQTGDLFCSSCDTKIQVQMEVAAQP